MAKEESTAGDPSPRRSGLFVDPEPDLRKTDWKSLRMLAFFGIVAIGLMSTLPVIHYYGGERLLFRVYEYVLFVVICVSVIATSAWRYRSIRLGFSLWHALAATTVIAVYITAWRSISPSEWGTTTSILSWFYTAHSAALLAGLIYYALSNWIYFAHPLHISSVVEKRLLVKPHVAAGPHVAVATGLLGVALLLRLTFGPLHSIATLLWIGAAVRCHAIAYERTAIWELADGVRLLNKRWRWENGSLKLVETNGETRLVPATRGDDDWPPLSWWPVVPEESREVVCEVLAQGIAGAEPGDAA